MTQTVIADSGVAARQAGESWRAEYPFEPHWLDIGGQKLHYVDERPADEGKQASDEPLLCLHGNPTWSFLYRKVVTALSPRRRVIALDHMGCGLSDKPQAYRYTLKQHIDNAEKLVNHLDLREITLCVHDWGGAIGFGLAARRPELFKRFVVLNTAAFASTRIPLSISICRVPGFGALAIRGFNAFVRGALARCSVKPLSRAAREGFLAPYANWHDRVANLRFVQDIPMRASHPSYATLADIDQSLHKLADRPMLICWGAHDFVFNDQFLAGWRKRFPAAEVHRFEHAGHFVLEDAHEDVIPLVQRFIGDAT